MKTIRSVIKFLLVTILTAVSFVAYSQNPTDSLPGDPGMMSVSKIQDLNFGTFASSGSGGTVIIANSGTRTSTGSIVLLNTVPSYHAIFDVETPAGSIISITNGPTATLSGSNGGSMTLNLGLSNPLSPFSTVVEPPAKTQVNIGGTLTIGNSSASPPGSYTGTFYVTFNYE